MTADFGVYLRELRHIREQPEATPELSLRHPLMTLMRDLAPTGTTIFGEAASVEGQPDVIVKRGSLVVGYGETKAPGTIHQLEAVLETPQLAAYRRLPNLLLTDYLHFILLRDGVEVRRGTLINAADLDAGHLTRADRTTATDILGAWLSAEPAQITSSERLAIELARRAAWLRDGIRAELRKEADESVHGHGDGPLRSLAKFYRENLMSDMDEDKFADAFAQTVAYGLFVGRYHLTAATFDRTSAILAIPTSTAFLRSATRFLLDETTVPAGLSWIIDDVVAILRASADTLVQQAGTVKAAESDAVIHFYESFLAAYDAGERIDRGIYYTHPPLVEYAVRTTDDALVTRFGINGLADGSVRLLDPAVGTGTFLVGVAQRAIARVKEHEGDAVIPALIEQHLLPHLYGFELLPAPYAICHLKLGSFYEQNGRPLRPDERANVFLTNTLADPITPTGGVLPAIGALVTETRSADQVKAGIPLLVIIGNPPYAESSHNKEHIPELMADFFRLDGIALKERNTRPLDDDYLRFLRWSVWKLLEQPGAPQRGIITLVTNSSFLSRTVTKGVRKFLLDRFDEIHILDLHGNQRDWFADRVDQKVFPKVQVGIAITALIRRTPQHAGPARVFYRETRGTVSEKFLYLAGASLGDAGWAEASPVAPGFSFIPRELHADYESWPSLEKLMPYRSPGVISHRDPLSTGLDAADVLAKMGRFADLTIEDREIHDAYPKRSGLDSNDRWNLHKRRAALAGHADPGKVRSLLYRPFDKRVIYDDVNVVGDRREVLRGHLERVENNLAIVSARSASEESSYAFVTAIPGTQALLSSRTLGAAVYFPLYTAAVRTIAPDEHLLPLHEDEQAASPNIEPGWLAGMRTAYGDRFTPETFAAYLYAVIASDAYRESYAPALTEGFPKIPLTADPALFELLGGKGTTLIGHHQMKLAPTTTPRLEGTGDLRVTRSRHAAESNRLYINDTQYLTPVSAAVWGTCVGNYQPLRLWLENREGRALSRADIAELARIAGSLDDSCRVMAEVNPIVSEVLDREMIPEP